MSDLSCVKCGRHFDAASARCPECGHLRGEPVAVWPLPLLPGADRWQAPLSAAQARSHPPEPIAARELDHVFDDPSIEELAPVADDEIMEIDDLDITDAGDDEKTVIGPAPVFARSEVPAVAAPAVAAPAVAAPVVAAPIVAAPAAALVPVVAPRVAAAPIVDESIGAKSIIAEPAVAAPVVAPPVVTEESAASWFDVSAPQEAVTAPTPFVAPAPSLFATPVATAASPKPAAQKSDDAWQFSWDDIIAPENLSGEVAPEEQLSEPALAAIPARATPAEEKPSAASPAIVATAPTEVRAATALPEITAAELAASEAPTQIRAVEGVRAAAQNMTSAPLATDPTLAKAPAEIGNDEITVPEGTPLAAPIADIERARLAPVWQRLFAGVIDLVPVAGATALALVALEPTLARAHLPLVPHSLDELARMWWALNWKVAIVAGALFGSAFLYQLLTFVYMQGTVGDFLFGIVWITRRGRRPGLARALWRSSWFLASFILCGAGYWFALLLPTKRPLYDWVSGVYPVKRRSIVFPAAPAMPDVAPAV